MSKKYNSSKLSKRSPYNDEYETSSKFLKNKKDSWKKYKKFSIDYEGY